MDIYSPESIIERILNRGEFEDDDIPPGTRMDVVIRILVDRNFTLQKENRRLKEELADRIILGHDSTTTDNTKIKC